MPDFVTPLLKRIFDVVVATLLAVTLLPLLAMIVLGSAVSLRAWPFFTQARLGHHRRPFTFIKVRSLPTWVAPDTDKYTVSSVRNTRFGNFLRVTHLDELPQLWLVIAGRMSLVGPRPEMPSLARTADPSFVEARCRVLPGCTGLWQISNRADELIHEAPEFDQFYVANHTLRLDCWILARTLLAFLGFHRPVSLEDVPQWALRQRSELRMDSVSDAETAALLEEAAAKAAEVS